MTTSGTLPEVFLQAEAAIAELEQEVCAYQEWAEGWAQELQSAGSAVANPSRGDAAPADARLAEPGWVNTHAGARGIASFWASFDFSVLSASVAAEADDSEVESAEVGAESGGGLLADATADLVAEPGEVGETPAEPPPELAEAEADGAAPDGEAYADLDMDEAMRQARAAALAELEADDDVPTAAAAELPVDAEPVDADDSQGGGVSAYVDDLVAKPLTELMEPPPVEEPAAADEGVAASPPPVEAELDEETARKLKMLRRLNPGKSEVELLAKIAEEGPAEPEAQGKRRWFGWK